MIEEDFTKSHALELAIRSGAGNEYDDCGKLTANPDKIVEAAKKFEAYLNAKKEI